MVETQVVTIVVGLLAVCWGLCRLVQLEVREPRDWALESERVVDGSPEKLFRMVIGSPGHLEKLIPWLVQLREADKKLVSPGKMYKAKFKLPLFGEKRVYAVLKELEQPLGPIALEVIGEMFKQRIEIETRPYHENRTLLRTTVFFRRKSLLFQTSLGWLMRYRLRGVLTKSLRRVSAVFQTIERIGSIPDLSGSRKW